MSRWTSRSQASLGLANGGYHYALCSTLQPARDPQQSAKNFAIISSDDLIRQFQLAQSDVPFKIIGHHQDVSCLARGPEQEGRSLIFTGGRDGILKQWDPRTGGGRMGQPVWHCTHAKKAGYLSIAKSLNCNLWASGTELASSLAEVQIWDLRKQVDPLASYVECHNDDVCVLRFSSSPNSASTLLSGSTDGLVNVYASYFPADEDEALQQVINHGSSVHLAGFLSPGPTNILTRSESIIYAVSHDEALSFYKRDDSETVEPQHRADKWDSQSDSEDKESISIGDVRPLLECEYVIDILDDGLEPLIAVGNHTESRVNLYRLSETLTAFAQGRATNKLLPLASQYTHQFTNAHHGEIVRDVAYGSLSNQIMMISAGEDANVAVWPVTAEQTQDLGVHAHQVEESQDVDMEASSDSEAQPKTGTSKKRKELQGGSKDRERKKGGRRPGHKPY